MFMNDVHLPVRESIVASSYIKGIDWGLSGVSANTDDRFGATEIKQVPRHVHTEDSVTAKNHVSVECATHSFPFCSG